MGFRRFSARCVLVLAGLGGLAAGPGHAVGAVTPESVWESYPIIMWQPQSAEGYAALREIGVSAGKIFARGPGATGEVMNALQAADLPWFVENIATDFLAPYHRWSPDKPVNWRYLAVQEAHRAAPSDLAPFHRDPSLEDPHWRARIRDRLTAVVTDQSPFRPLYYSLADEAGIADLSAYWDFDLSPRALAAFRRALKAEYGSLEALNRAWGSAFAAWGRVQPRTAVEQVRAGAANMAPWADFRAWMDRSFAEAVGEARDAVHAADPAALAGLEGGQIPGWGGYDYARLAPAVDVLELYDMGRNTDIVRSLSPETRLLSTTQRVDPANRTRLWRALLHGGRGLILWDSRRRFLRADGTLGPEANLARPFFRELRGGIGALVIASQPAPAPVAVHYSAASFRVAWMLDRIAEGVDSIAPYTVSGHPIGGVTVLRDQVCDAVEALGGQVRFLSKAQIEAGGLTASDVRVLLLPRSVALSDAEGEAIAAFAEAGGLVVAAGAPGTHDAHGRVRPVPALAPLIETGAVRMVSDSVDAMDLRDRLRPLLAQVGALSSFRLDGGAGDGVVEVRVLENGAVSLVALLPSRPVSGTLRLPASAYVYDIRAGQALGEMETVSLDLPGPGPVLLAVSPRPLPDIVLTGPDRARAGDTAILEIRRAGPSPDETQVFRVDLRDPRGRPVDPLPRVVRAGGGRVRLPLTVPLDAGPGLWSVTVTDVMSGHQTAASFAVTPSP